MEIPIEIPSAVFRCDPRVASENSTLRGLAPLEHVKTDTANERFANEHIAGRLWNRELREFERANKKLYVVARRRWTLRTLSTFPLSAGNGARRAIK